jgi:hypothetical protein
MSTALVNRDTTADAIEQVLIGGDLARLSPDLRVAYYNRVCESLGLNPLTKPFAYITLNGKLVLYALKDATEQLRKRHGVAIVELTSQRLEDVFVVTAKAQDKSGRTDASTGAVAIGSLKGEALANALMKAETKAKRRVTLSICGLGMLDETEVETVPQASGYTVTAPSLPTKSAPVVSDAGLPSAGAVVGATRVVPSEGEPSGQSDGALRIERVDHKPTKNQNVTKFVVVLSDGREVSTIKTPLGTLAEQLCQDGDAVEVETKATKWGDDLLVLRRQQAVIDIDHTEPLTDDDIPF